MENKPKIIQKIVYDDFNHRIRNDQSTIGTVVQQYSRKAEGNGYKVVELDLEKIRIRKLTPRECYRLMGFDDEDFDKAKEVNSDSQLYKQAGNSIVVNVLMAIFKEML